MTSTAADSRYGRQGGRWATSRTGPGVCETCRNGTPRYHATHLHRNDIWLVCGSCRTQAHRYHIPATFTPLNQEPEPA